MSTEIVPIIIVILLVSIVAILSICIIVTFKKGNCNYGYFTSIDEPIDHRIIVQEFEDLLVLDKYHIQPFRGMMVFVLKDDGLFQLEDPDYKRSESWVRIN